ncbi:MAG: class I SAM-dependent rRNA methyltransferase [Proteobacteria bacterium]|nr:class I SAM-dependent rRNA methyltransferase [Pseudomonadota bacterium]
MAQLIVKQGRARPLWHGHPWIFAQAVGRLVGEAEAGDVVEVLDADLRSIGRAAYNPRSAIAARMLSWRPDELIDRAWLARRLASALRLRQSLALPSSATDCYRLVNAEGDGLPGLVVDVYGRAIVVQFTGNALQRRAEWIYAELDLLLEPSVVVEASPGAFAAKEGLGEGRGLLRGTSTALRCRENGLAYAVELGEGQKTGLFLDQRENHRRIAERAAGRRVLDLYCYTGAFGLNAAQAGASAVTAVDSSARALAAASRNAANNGLQLTLIEADAMPYLATQQPESFDLIVLDPPKFAAHRSQVPAALKGYHKLLRLALNTISAGGLLALACCSQLIPLDELRRVMARAAAEAQCELRLLERCGAGADHPSTPAFPEGEYLTFLLSAVHR